MNDIPPPAVKFPPPLLYLAMILLGWLLDYLLALPAIGLAPVILTLAGGAALLAGIAVNLISFLRFRKEKENVIPWTESKKMIADGVYKITRNPMYLGMSLIALGIGVLAGSYAIVAAAMLATVIIDRLVILREEAYLEDCFGQNYLDYKQRVRRWI